MSGNELFPFTEEHEMIRQTAREFAQKEIAPIAAEYDESGEFPYETIMKMGEMGFMGIEVPEEYGGAGMDTLAYVLALEEICKADAAHGIIMSVNNSLYCYGIQNFGSEAQKQEFLAPVASGKSVGAYSRSPKTGISCPRGLRQVCGRIFAD
jgi:alkylation response protein AidB-like acyl-CoA dehydrogenase